MKRTDQEQPRRFGTTRRTPAPMRLALVIALAVAAVGMSVWGVFSIANAASANAKCKPFLTATYTVNIRSGPSTAYSVLGELPQGSWASVIARTPDNSWYEIIYQGLQGWVIATYTVPSCVTNKVPIVVWPVPPNPTPTPIPPPPPTLVPPPLQPTPLPTINFWASNTTIDYGECTTIYWTTSNVNDVYYNDGSGYHGVVGDDSSVECPSTTTTYDLNVLLNNGQTVQQSVTVNVINAPPPTVTPVPLPTAAP